MRDVWGVKSVGLRKKLDRGDGTVSVVVSEWLFRYFVEHHSATVVVDIDFLKFINY